MQDYSDATLYQLTQQLAQALQSKGLRLVTAESCTGGWLAKCCTDWLAAQAGLKVVSSATVTKSNNSILMFSSARWKNMVLSASKPLLRWLLEPSKISTQIYPSQLAALQVQMAAQLKNQ